MLWETVYLLYGAPLVTAMAMGVLMGEVQTDLTWQADRFCSLLPVAAMEAW